MIRKDGKYLKIKDNYGAEPVRRAQKRARLREKSPHQVIRDLIRCVRIIIIQLRCTVFSPGNEMIRTALQDFFRNRYRDHGKTIGCHCNRQLTTGKAVMHRLIHVDLLHFGALHKLIFDVSLL